MKTKYIWMYYGHKGTFDRNTTEVRVMKEICTLCNYILEEERGLPEAGIAPGTKFESLPEDWRCPGCAASKEFFPDLFLRQSANFRSQQGKKPSPMRVSGC